MYYEVLIANQRFHGKGGLSYRSDQKLKTGQIVAVPMQNQTVHGIVEAEVSKPTFTTKEISNTWDLYINSKSLQLLSWMADYYPAPIGVITELLTPPKLNKNLEVPDNTSENHPSPVLPDPTDEQSKILKSIDSEKQSSILLHGNTGTGKTRIYIELAKKSLQNKKSVMILTPEIGLTGQLLDSFTESFGKRVVVTHSDMTPSERRRVWMQAYTSENGMIVIGPRSAIFSPLKNIGLIVVDEAHDSAYKQEKAPYFQTTRVAAKLANLHGAVFVMGTATPLIGDYYTFENKKLQIFSMTKSAVDSDEALETSIIDLRNKEQFTKSPWVSNSLLEAMTTALNNNEQSLLFLNRRGSARLVLCNNCGWQATCEHCDTALTYHHDSYLMRCHSCDFSSKVPTLCPNCSGHELIFRSIGTKALESEIARIFPGAKISRFDRDTEKSLRLNNQIAALRSGDIDILIGTQSIAKGFDLPKLAVVGIVNADSGLQIPDYTATERTFQLISQVSGRVGRGHRAGKLYVQTFDPESSIIQLALSKNYETFYKQELKQRELYNFPPFTYLLKITFSRATSQSAYNTCKKFGDELVRLGSGITVEGPSPRFIEKISGRFAWHLIVKSKNRGNLTNIINGLPNNCTYDLDPNDLL